MQHRDGFSYFCGGAWWTNTQQGGCHYLYQQLNKEVNAQHVYWEITLKYHLHNLEQGGFSEILPEMILSPKGTAQGKYHQLG